MPTTPILSVNDVVAGYTSHTDVLRDVSLEIGEGEAVALLGANGAGKTTLLRVISGLLPLRSGAVGFSGQDISGLPAYRIARAGIAHVPEGRQILAHQTVRDNLLIGDPLSRHGGERFDQLLEVFPDLREKLDQSGDELSGGQQQMLAIARGLMANPKLLMLDEPSLGLSPKLVDEVIQLLIRVRKEFGTAVLLVEQSTSIAAEVTDRACVLRLGELVMEGSAEELLTDEKLLSAYLG